MTIKDIKTRHSILQVLDLYGLRPDRNNRIHCPFHDDKTPSMQVYAATNTVYCFSSNCRLHGKAIDQIDFIMHREEISKHRAILKAQSMLDIPVATAPASKTVVDNQPEGLEAVFLQMRRRLHRSKNALRYLKERNLHPTGLEIGYNHYQTDFKHLRNCIIFPLKNIKGEVVSLYGRSITGQGDNAHYYLKNRRGLYPGYPAPDTTSLIIVEAIIDAATLMCHLSEDTGAVLSLYGTNGWNEEHTEVIRSLKDLQEVILFFDGDEAGNKAVETHASLLRTMKPGIKISRVNTPQGEDANSLLSGHESGILNHLIEERTFLFSNEKSSSENKKVQEVAPLTLDTSNPPYELTVVGTGDYIVMQTDKIRFTVIGGIALYPLDKMKVTLKIEKKGSNRPMHRLRQNIDLYQDDSVEKLARKAAERLETGSTGLHESLLQLTELMEQYRRKQIEAKKVKVPQKRVLTAEERQKAIAFLKSKNLLKRTNQAIGKSGVVGEENNRLLMYLIFTSRLREHPLHIVSLGGSGTGKTYLQEKVSELIPDDQKLEITAISENALYYFEQKELKNKLVLIEDLDGASDDKVLFAIRELQSKRRISKTIPIKDSKGNLKTVTLQVEGPISLAGTTTRERLYEDNANRSLLIYLDASRTHKEQIMDYQRRVSAGKINRSEEEKIRAFMQNVQSVLRPVNVINPFAEMLALPQSVFKPLRTNSHYLHFIETVTFYHQYQRPHKVNPHTGEAYIETTIEDIEAANELLRDVLLAKSDELTKATRRFLELIEAYLKQEGKDSFYSGALRKAYRISPATVKRQLLTLKQYGYIKVVGGSKFKGYEYELAEQEENGQENLKNALEEALDKIKEWLTGSPVAQNAT